VFSALFGQPALKATGMGPEFGLSVFWYIELEKYNTFNTHAILNIPGCA
jgi:hypothetical protein